MGIPALRGRVCTEADREDSPAVVIINQSFAEKYWPTADPIGKELQFPDADIAAGSAAGSFSAQIIGVVGDVRQYELREEHRPQVYFCYAQKSGIFATLVVRAAVDPMSLSEAVRAAVWKVDREQPVWKIRTIEFLIERDVAPDRFLMFLMSGFGVLALLLTALGTYGVISYAVTQRTREFGVRIALGATPARLFGLVLRHALLLALVGAAFGIGGALAGATLIRRLLYGVSPADPATLAAVTLLLTVVALLACYLPARRATRVDPLVALRYE
jgi:putative ABC transport system permease protein